MYSTMFLKIFYIFLLFNRLINNFVNCQHSPRIVIVGAGPSGIAAASKLYENGFENILILEAQDRIGGRVYTTQFGEYVIDLGGQWVHGQKNNIAYDLAAPLDLLENSTWHFATFDSTGAKLDDQIFQDTVNLYEHAFNNVTLSDCTISAGEFLEQKFADYFNDHPEINTTLQNELLSFFNLVECSLSASDDWYEPSLNGEMEYEVCEGNLSINWKKRGYSTILDILMKRYPDPSKELPIMNKTLLNSEVINIDYSGNDSIKIHTNTEEYLADHVIVTPSLGVLKADYKTLFTPSLPESKITTINGLAFGTACKIFLHFDEPWWEFNSNWRFNFLFNETYKNEIENDPDKKWITNTTFFGSVENKPHLLLGWVTPKGCRFLETLPDDKVLKTSMELLHTFMGNHYNITEANAIIRSNWTHNKHFRGTYSFRSIESEKVNATAEKLSEPIIKNQRPTVLFAGEATSKRFYSTVHGAIDAGWREADRIIKLYTEIL
ncbi:PREDICTED: spermine oxidase-like [Polistes dominula]|uniref:Spermine oxidase-like n=1 Tax=Polistes dominula TaxID=743375 RepID=A0ABM1I658_POLDO|nr:PREDICTED: spermine oxidase-like [Polistes dominula]